MLTADTITDEQIRGLLRDAEAHAYPGADPKWHEQWIAADVALHQLHNVKARESIKYKARARCAEILNARAKEAK